MFGRVLSVLALGFSFAVASAVVAIPSDAGIPAEAAGVPPFVVYDAIGDAAGAADITSVAVARDTKNRVTFAVNVADHPSPKRGDLFSVGLDTDRRLSTGDQGIDVALMLGWWPGRQRPTYDVLQWVGSDWQPLDVTADVSYPEHGLRFTVAMDALGLGRSFGLEARTKRLSAPAKGATDGAVAGSDTLRTPATIAAMGRVLVPGTAMFPEAGKVLKVRGVEIVVESDRTDVTDGLGAAPLISPEKQRCSAKIGRVQLRPVAFCAWRVPRDAKGKTLMLRMSLAYGGDEWTGVYPLGVE
jgi:hypothetical protein